MGLNLTCVHIHTGSTCVSLFSCTSLFLTNTAKADISSDVIKRDHTGSTNSISSIVIKEFSSVVVSGQISALVKTTTKKKFSTFFVGMQQLHRTRSSVRVYVH